MLGAGRTAAHDHDPLPGELLGPGVLRGVQLPPPEGLLAGIAGPERPVPGPGGVDQRASRPGPVRSLHEQPSVLALANGRHVDGPPYPQAEGALVPVEVRAEDLRRGPRRIGVRQLHAGQRVHPVHLAVRQRRPAELPGAARPGGVVEDHEVAVRFETGAPQVIGAGQSGLSGACDDYLHLACFVHPPANSGHVTGLPGRSAPAAGAVRPPR